MTLKEYLKQEKEKISGMPARNQIRYIAEYYWLWIAGILFAVFFAAYLIYHLFFTVNENWFFLIITNVSTDEQTIRRMQNDFADYAGYDLKEKQVLINAASYFDASISGGTNNTYYQVFTAASEAGDLDAVIMSRENLKATGASGILMDLSSSEYADLFAGYEELFVTCIPYDDSYSTEEIPVGIDISSSVLNEQYGLCQEGCVLGVNAHAPHPEAVLTFLRFIGVRP